MISGWPGSVGPCGFFCCAGDCAGCVGCLWAVCGF